MDFSYLRGDKSAGICARQVFETHSAESNVTTFIINTLVGSTDGVATHEADPEQAVLAKVNVVPNRKNYWAKLAQFMDPGIVPKEMGDCR